MLAIGCGALVASAIACSSGVVSPTSPPTEIPAIGLVSPSNGGDNSGTVQAFWQIPGGYNVPSLAWTISGGPGGPYSGTADIGDAMSAEWTAGGVLAGCGYTIAVQGFDSNGDPCNGKSASFCVQAGISTAVAVAVTCVLPNDATVPADVTTGSVAVDASITVVQNPPFVCPGISSFSINPAEIAYGGSASLGLTSVGPVSTIAWTVSPSTGATITNPTAANATLTCATPGTYTVTATVLPDGGLCQGVQNTSLSAQVVCDPQCTKPTDCPGTDTACLFRSCNAPGTCGMQNAAEGTLCSSADGGASQVCNGAGACVPFTFDVVRVGSGAVTLTTQSAAVFLEQRNVNGGALVGSAVSFPISASGSNQPFVEPGIAVGVMLNRSADGRYVSVPGYAVTPGTSNPANTTIPIVVGRVDSNGNVDTSTVLPGASFVHLNALRSAVSTDGGAFYVGGTGTSMSGGIWYVPFGAADAGSQLSTSNVRDLSVVGGQLYGTGEVATAGNDAGSPEAFLMSGGLPTTGLQSLTTLNGLPPQVMTSTASPWQFALLDMLPSIAGVDTLYIANDTTVGDAGGAVMGIQRWSFNGSVWSLTATLTMPSADGGAGPGFRGLAALNVGNDAGVGGTATLIATTAETAANRIVVFTDDGVSSPWNGTSNVVATAPDGGTALYRGVSLSPH